MSAQFKSEVPIRWNDQGVPYSINFNDHYFCKHNGYEEAVHVSCAGNLLPERFAQLDPQHPGTFTIIETGFGTGLNFCCAWELWQKSAPASWNLHFISIELYPVAAEDLKRALEVWPGLSSYKEALAAQYKPSLIGSVDHLDFGQVRLSIVVDHVLDALAKIKDQGLAPNKADAWFLNGFAPFKNPQMWTPQVFAGMVPLSKEGTTLATFTVAGHVRRGLQACGFKVSKTPGHGIKKEKLQGYFVP